MAEGDTKTVRHWQITKQWDSSKDNKEGPYSYKIRQAEPVSVCGALNVGGLFVHKPINSKKAMKKIKR